jgi:hypothetical protein
MLKFLLKAKFKEVICSDENSGIPGAIYYTEMYDENMMRRIRVGLCCSPRAAAFRTKGDESKERLRTSEGVKPQTQAANDENPCHDLLASDC